MQTQRIAQITAFLCFAWMFSWILWGATGPGKSWYTEEIAKTFSKDHPKDFLPILVMGLPILISGAVASKCLIQKPLEFKRRAVPTLPHDLPRWVHKCFRVLYRGGYLMGDLNRVNAFLLFILIPMLVYVGCYLSRYSSSDDDNERVMHQANAFGFGALIGLNLQMIPVARFSPLLRLVGWSQARAVCFHRWIGLAVICFIMLHGGIHTYRFAAIQHENLWHMFTIPAGCWSDWDGYQPTCNLEEDCTCFHHFRNLTGAVAVVPFLIIFFSSLEPVRRSFYFVFYRIHVIAGPLSLLIIILHWHRAIFYLSGGLLYYLASSLPVFVENKNRLSQAGVSLVSAELVESEAGSDSDSTVSGSAERPCISLTMRVTQSAMERYRAGQYVRLHCPEIAQEAHPFTINQVYKTNTADEFQMRLIFRQTGRFTTRLGRRLFDSNIPPSIHLDGFHGSHNRLDQIVQHDTVLMVAGGIGITPYLSLLQQIHDFSAENCITQTNRKLVHLHWICRDQALINYVRSEYLDRIVDTSEGEYDIRCTIHYTGKPCDVELTEHSLLSVRTSGRQEFENSERSEPFQPSKFAVGSKSTFRENNPVATSFLMIGGFGLVICWVCSLNWEIGFVIVAFPLLLFAVLVATLLNEIMPDDGDLLTALTCRDASVNTSYLGLCELVESEETATDVESGAERKKLDFGKIKQGSKLSSIANHVNVVEGRPYFLGILSDANLDDAFLPAVLACGPTSMMKSLRKALTCQSCSQGGQLCSCVAMYEEAFEM